MWRIWERREIMQDFGLGHRRRLLGRRRCRWKDDAEIDGDSSGSGLGRVASWCEHRRILWIKKNAGSCWAK